MYGYDKSYSELLYISELDTLKDRREEALLKFAKKTMENENYKHLFPLKECARTLRKTDTFLEEYARTDKLYRSPLFTMRRLLNGTETESNDRLITDQSHVFNDPFD